MHRIGSSERPDLSLAVVVGAGGMGMAAARRLCRHYRILIADIDGARVQAAAEMLRAEGGDAVGVACDITDTNAVDALSEAVDKSGGFRVLAHVAGLSPSMADFDTIIRVNLSGAACVAESLLPLATTGTAAILIASLAAHNFQPPEAVAALLKHPRDPHLADKLKNELGPEFATPQQAYPLSKYALIAYCRQQAGAWGAQGARIVSLSPGLIATPMGALEFEKNPHKMKLFERTPLKREGTMLEIADAIAFLASDKASFISGTDLLVDGGLAGTLSA